MTKKKRFTFRINSDEKRMIDALSQRLQRNQSDTVRWVLREAFRSLDLDDRIEGQSNADAE